MENNIAYKGRKKVTNVKSLSNEELYKLKEENKIAWEQLYKEIDNKEAAFQTIVGLMFFLGTYIIARSVSHGDATMLEGFALLGGELAAATAAFGFDKSCSTIQVKLHKKISDKKYGPVLEEIEERREAENKRRKEEERLEREMQIKAIDAPVELTEDEKDRIDRMAKEFVEEKKNPALFNMDGVKQFIEYTLHNGSQNRIKVININDDGSFVFELYHCDPNTPLGFYFSNYSYYSVSYCDEENKDRVAKIERVDIRIFKDGEDVTDDSKKMDDYRYNSSNYERVFVPVEGVEPIYLDSNGLKLEESRGRKI